MAVLTITDVDDELRTRPMQRAAQHGRSAQAEAHGNLKSALGIIRPAPLPDDLYGAIRAIVEPRGGMTLQPLPRDVLREPPDFG